MPSETLPISQVPLDGGDQAIFRSLFVAYPDAMLLVDESGCIMLANPSAAHLLGYSLEELVGLRVDALVPDGIRPQHSVFRAAYAQAPRARPMGTQRELTARRKDGSEVVVEIALSPLRHHEASLVVVAMRGISDYPRVKQAVQWARYSEQLAQMGRLAVDARDPQVLLDHLPAMAVEALQVDVCTVFVLERNLLEFCIAGGMGLVDGEAVGQRVPNVADTPPGFVVQQGSPLTVQDYRSESRFGVPQAYLDAGLRSALAVPLLDRGHMLGVLSVSARNLHHFGEDEVRFLESLANLLATSLQRALTEDALNHAQRLESVGQLTGGIAHDFNNLLTVILGNLQVLEELPTLVHDSYGLQLVAAATRASKRGAELTGKLLAFSRLQVLQPKAVDVGELLHALSDMLQRTLDQRIRIHVSSNVVCPAVLADPGQLESALLNIAINARDAMPKGGALRFRAEVRTSLPSELRNELDGVGTPEQSYVAISIFDTGSGMPESVKERAFEPFFTTKEAGRGTGLGLSTVYGFVKQSKGAITLDSTIGVGTVVTLYLPVAKNHKSANGLAISVHQAPPDGLRVLLVEDDSDVRSVVRTFLEAMGCKVTAEANGEQALLILQADAIFDVLLTDIALGVGLRGTQLATLAEQRHPQVAILLMSGFSSELLDADQTSPPHWELLRKPFTRDELRQAVLRVVNSH